jgi:hypothetical protein
MQHFHHLDRLQLQYRLQGLQHTLLFFFVLKLLLLVQLLLMLLLLHRQLLLQLLDLPLKHIVPFLMLQRVHLIDSR